MAGNIAVTIENGEKYRNGLALLPKRIASKVVSQGLRAGAKVIQNEAQRLVPVDTGTLRQSIKVRTGKARRGEKKIVVITGEGFFKGQEFYGAFVEFGHRRGKRTSSERRLQKAAGETRDPKQRAALQASLDKISRRKKVPARPFMRPAFDNKKDEATVIIGQTIGSGIEREWRALIA